MGKMALILVMGFAVTLGIATRSIVGRLGEAVDNSSRYYDKTYAKNIASSAAEIYIRRLKTGAVGPGHYHDSFMGGQDSVIITQISAGKSPDTLKMVTVGKYDREYIGGGIYKSVTDTIVNIVIGNLTINPPNVTGAITVSYGTKAGIKAGFGDTISGYNHDLTGKLDTNSCATVAGISYGSRYDSTYSNVSSAKVVGKGPISPDVEYNPFQPNYDSLANQLISLKDTTLTSDVNSPTTLGTLAKPMITYSPNAIKFNSTVTGAGILIISGDLNIKGSFKFTGLIIVLTSGKNEAKINCAAGTGSFIDGAVIEAGTDSKVNIGGAINILYSCQAISLAFSEPKLQGNYIVASWWE